MAVAAALLLQAQSPAPVPSPAAMSLDAILKAHLAAVRAMGASSFPRTLVTAGTLEGLGARGTFAFWRDGDKQRDDEMLGLRSQRTLRLGDRVFVQNADGDVRAIHGLEQLRRVTEDFIDSGDFARHPESDALLGFGHTLDGRAVWRLRVTPPGGTTYGVGLDASTWMVDEKAYPEGDGVATIEYADYRAIDGALVPFLEVDSDGDRAFDITSRTTGAHAGAAVDPSVFAPLVSTVIDAPAPVTVALVPSEGHVFVRATVDGHPMTLLVDSGSQGIVIDSGTAQRLSLPIQGRIQIRGSTRMSGGLVPIASIALGAATLPVRVASVVDLSYVRCEGKTADGVLGYPLFAAAEVRIDPEKLTMTVAKPGTLPVRGSAISVDTDRELPEIEASIDHVAARLLVDTGNADELLVFHAFLDAHPGLISTQNHFAGNSGVGGSNAALPAMVDDLKIGPFDLYNRYANVILASSGAFADNAEAGNVGWGSLRNFVMTFDLAEGSITLEKTRWFDEGRYRSP